MASPELTGGQNRSRTPDFFGIHVDSVAQPIVERDKSHVDHGRYSSRISQLIRLFQFFSLGAEVRDNLFHGVNASLVWL